MRAGLLTRLVGRVAVQLKTFCCGKLLLTLPTGVRLLAADTLATPYVHPPKVGGQEVLLHQCNASERLRTQRTLQGSFTTLVGLAMISKGGGTGKFFDAISTFKPARRKAQSNFFHHKILSW